MAGARGCPGQHLGAARLGQVVGRWGERERGGPTRGALPSCRAVGLSKGREVRNLHARDAMMPAQHWRRQVEVHQLPQRISQRVSHYEDWRSAMCVATAYSDTCRYCKGACCWSLVQYTAVWYRYASGRHTILDCRTANSRLVKAFSCERAQPLPHSCQGPALAGPAVIGIVNHNGAGSNI